METGEPPPSGFEQFVGQQVVLDAKGPFLYIGLLESIRADCFVLSEVDVHHRDESTTGSELYIIQSRRHGVRANRRRVHVLAREVASLSLLSDIIPY